MTLKKALEIAKTKEGYERCLNPAHGLGTQATIKGKTAKVRFVICPIVQITPRPTYLFHSQKDFLSSSEASYRKLGWIK